VRGADQPGPSQTPKGKDEVAMIEALEISRKAQVYAYQRDRSRETTRPATSRRRYVTRLAGEGTGAVVAASEALKHTPDSNRAPLKKSSEFPPSYGSLGKAAARTIEVQAVRATRPQTVPAPG